MRELPRSQNQINKGGINSCYVSKTVIRERDFLLFYYVHCYFVRTIICYLGPSYHINHEATDISLHNRYSENNTFCIVSHPVESDSELNSAK